jgi:hypothetical protein
MNQLLFAIAVRGNGALPSRVSVASRFSQDFSTLSTKKSGGVESESESECLGKKIWDTWILLFCMTDNKFSVVSAVKNATFLSFLICCAPRKSVLSIIMNWAEDWGTDEHTCIFND